jgi:hypothetical protein
MLLACTVNMCASQHSLFIFVKDSQSGEPLIGTTVRISEPIKLNYQIAGAVAFHNLPDSVLTISLQYVGYEEKRETIRFQEKTPV